MLYSFNPLSENLAPLWDFIALIITFVVIQALVLVNGFLQKRQLLPTYITRKIIHIFAAPLYLVCWLLYSDGDFSRYFAAVVPLAFIGQFAAIGLGLRKDEAFVKSMSRSGNPRELLGGTMHYAIVMLVVTILFFDAGGGKTFNPAAIFILGALAGGDGLADIIGRRFGGKTTFGIGGATKTPVGTVAMFVGSLLMIFALGAVFGPFSTLDVGTLIVPALILSALATVVEAITPRGVDNYTISMAVLAGIAILVFADQWTFGPPFTL